MSFVCTCKSEYYTYHFESGFGCKDIIIVYSMFLDIPSCNQSCLVLYYSPTWISLHLENPFQPYRFRPFDSSTRFHVLLFSIEVSLDFMAFTHSTCFLSSAYEAFVHYLESTLIDQYFHIAKLTIGTVWGHNLLQNLKLRRRNRLTKLVYDVQVIQVVIIFFGLGCGSL